MLTRRRLAFACYFEPVREARSFARLNHEGFFVRTPGEGARFLSDPGAYCGRVTFEMVEVEADENEGAAVRTRS